MSLSGLHWNPLLFIISSRHSSESHIEGLENPVKKQITKLNDSTLEFLKIYCTILIIPALMVHIIKHHLAVEILIYSLVIWNNAHLTKLTKNHYHLSL